MDVLNHTPPPPTVYIYASTLSSNVYNMDNTTLQFDTLVILIL